MGNNSNKSYHFRINSEKCKWFTGPSKISLDGPIFLVKYIHGYKIGIKNQKRHIYYTNPGRFVPNSVRPASRFAPIPVCPDSLSPSFINSALKN